MKKESERKRESKQSPRGDGGSSWRRGRAGWSWWKEGRCGSNPCSRGADPGTEASRRGVPPELRSACGNQLRRPRARRRESTRTVERQHVRKDLTHGLPCSLGGRKQPTGSTELLRREDRCPLQAPTVLLRAGERTAEGWSGRRPEIGNGEWRSTRRWFAADTEARQRSLIQRRGPAALADPEGRRSEDVGTARGFDTRRLLGKARLGRCSGGRS
ncbi:hornerin-like [Iris pallida]|uniref:Hornerin-like n=1 Tax=Iris pallida TaxID=29817 RepID=A0AAX6FLD0_IRIPA|nr:hornerin-like [Iris pallida]